MGMSVVEFAQKEERTAAESELSLQIWAVISFERCEGSEMTYPDASRLMNELDLRGVPGLCVVTNEAASHIKTQE